MTYKRRMEMRKIIFAAIFLSLSVLLSLLELGIPAAGGAVVPIEFGNILIFLATPFIGLKYVFIIVIVKPWLHILLPHDFVHPPMFAVFKMAVSLFTFVCWYLLQRWIFKKDNWYCKTSIILLTSILAAAWSAINGYYWGYATLVGVSTSAIFSSPIIVWIIFPVIYFAANIIIFTVFYLIRPQLIRVLKAVIKVPLQKPIPFKETKFFQYLVAKKIIKNKSTVLVESKIANSQNLKN